ncbi:MAG: hypothetical protein R3F29_05365 [Planctomycetota bacterium]
MPLAGANAKVSSVCEAANGDLVIGGWFRTVGNAVADRVARWDGSTWSPLGEGVDDSVFAVAALPGGDIVVGGLFTHAGGVAADHIARWDGVSWSPIGAGFDGPISALLVEPNGDLIAAGAFAHSGATPISRVARLSGGVWTPIGAGIDNGHVYSLARLPNGDLAAGGVFLGGARLWDGSSWQSLGLSNGAQVFAMTTTNAGELVLGGWLVTPNQSFSLGMWQGGGVVPMVSPIDQQVTSVMRTSSGDLLVGGRSGVFAPPASVVRGTPGSWTVLDDREQNVQVVFERANGTLIEAVSSSPLPSRPAIATYDGNTWVPIGAPAFAQPRAIAGGRDDEVFVGGAFDEFGGVAANNVAQMRGDVITPLGQGVNGQVTAIAVAPDGAAIVGGAFDQAGGSPAAHIARWSGSAWNTLGAGLDVAPKVLHVADDGRIFALCESTPQVRVFDGLTWTALPPLPLSFTPMLRDIAETAAGEPVVVGLLTAGAYRFDGVAWQAIGPQVQLWNGFSVDRGPDGDLFVMTSFSSLFPNTSIVARWDGNSWSPHTSSYLGSIDGALVLPNGNVVAWGMITDPTWLSQGHVALWDGADWYSIDGGVRAATSGVGSVSDAVVNGAGELSIIGFFTQAGDHVSSFLARAVSDCPASAVPAGSGCIGGAGPVTLSASDLPWIGATMHSQAVGMTANSLALHAIGTTPIALPLPLGAPGCSLQVQPELTALLLPQNGVADASLALPPAASLIGLTIRTQVIGLELDPSLALLQLTSSNALDLTIGSL